LIILTKTSLGVFFFLEGKAAQFTIVPQVKNLSVCTVILICSNKTRSWDGNAQKDV